MLKCICPQQVCSSGKATSCPSRSSSVTTARPVSGNSVSLKQVMKSATFTGRAPYRGYAAGTPPSTLSTLPVLLPERASEAKCMTASAMSSGRMFTPSVVRLR